MMAAMFTLPDDIDDHIRALVDKNSRLTIELVVRDIVRIKFIFHLLETKKLSDDTVLCGGMAMRCYGSSRMSVRDTDTSTKLELDRGMFAEAMAYEDDDVRIIPEGVEAGRELFSVKPIAYDPFFTTLPVRDRKFHITVNQRGLERAAVWRTFISGYPFDLGTAPDAELPVMSPNEMLAEKLWGWWMNGHARHYADVAWLGAVLERAKLHENPAVRADVRELVDIKGEVNRKWVSAKRHAQLTPGERRRRLEDPDPYVDVRASWETISYLGTKQFSPEALKDSVRRVIIPLLFD
jgi:hypothetical protein